MTKYELKMSETWVDSLNEIFKGCTIYNPHPEAAPYTIKSYESEKDAIDDFSDRRGIKEKRSRDYHYTEFYLEKINCDDEGTELSRDIFKICELPDESEADQIRNLRLAAKLTQKQLAEMFEISLSSVKSWECGRRTPPKWALKILLEKIAELSE